MIPFKLRGEYIELGQLLKAASFVATGGEAKIAITSGLVKVDGQVDKRKGAKIRAGQVVEFNGETIKIEA